MNDTPAVPVNDFPALAEKPFGLRLAYLDNAASTQKPQCVVDALSHALTGAYANIHRGLYHNSTVTTQAYEDARKTAAAFLKAPAHGIIFTRNSTEGINLVTQTWGRSNLTASSIVTISEIEHHANIVPWQLLQTEIGFTLRVIPATMFTDASPELLTPYLEGASLLALTQMSNVTGLRPPLHAIIPLAKSLGLKVLVDGSQGSVHGPQNLTTMGVDFYVATGHKLYGPTGIGILYANPQLMEKMPPYQGGGDMIEQVSLPTGTTFTEGPARFEAGTPAIAEAIALAEALRYVENQTWASVMQHEQRMAQRLTKELSDLPYVEYLSPADTGIAAFNLKGCHPSDVATLLDQQGVAVRTGHHCAMPYLKALKTTSCLRASIALYTTEEDISQLVESLEKTHHMLKDNG